MLLAVLKDLLPVLVILYLAEGLAWVGARNLLFVRWPWGWRKAEGRGVRLAGFLPFDFAVSVPGPVVIATEDALHVPDAEASRGALYDPGRWVRLGYEKASTELEEGTVHLRALRDQPGAGRLKFPSRAHAQDFTELLAELRPLAPAARSQRLDRHRAKAFDAASAETRLGKLRETTEFLRILGWGLFVLLLLLLPAVLYVHPRPDRLLLPLLTGIFLLYGAVLVATTRIGTDLCRQGILPRRPSLLHMMFSPVAAVRALAALSRDLFVGVDPLVAAALLLKKGDFVAMARAELHGAAVAAERGEGDWSRYWRRYWEARREATLALLARFEVSEAEALAAPPRKDPGAAAWCPVCGTESTEAGSCDDCGLPLLDLSSTSHRIGVP